MVESHRGQWIEQNIARWLKMFGFTLRLPSTFWWLSARLQYLKCKCTGDTAVLHKAINFCELNQSFISFLCRIMQWKWYYIWMLWDSLSIYPYDNRQISENIFSFIIFARACAKRRYSISAAPIVVVQQSMMGYCNGSGHRHNKFGVWNILTCRCVHVNFR